MDGSCIKSGSVIETHNITYNQDSMKRLTTIEVSGGLVQASQVGPERLEKEGRKTGLCLDGD